ncbi:NACHT domain-containing protein [Micromonospora sp. NBC_01392]|uniref:NACHT domain-containing protein n=1 Tax=Micromonospora sp. NBC_01392 TaxID=2903588 RepID=UPI0032480110
MYGLDIKTAAVTAIAVPLIFLVLKRISRFVQENANQILDAGVWIADRFIAESITTRMSLKRYCHAELAKDTTKFLQVPGAAEAALPTDSTFVPLRLESASRHAKSTQDIWRDEATRVQIIGDPGSGKTSLVKRTFRDACWDALQSKQAPLPIVVDLKNFLPPKRTTSERALGDWAIRHLREKVESVGGYQMGKLFDLSLGGRGLMVLLDGLDEVSTDSYPIVAKAISTLSQRMANAGPSNKLALTMRTQFYKQIHSSFSEAFPIVYHVQPFTPTDIYSFLSVWPYPDGVPRNATINRIFAELTDRPTLREMCSNPLVLAMYVASDQGGNSVGTPDTRTGFYSRVVDELLLFRRNRQLDLPMKSTVREQRERLFGKLSFENLTDPSQPANLINWDRALAVTSEIYGCNSEQEAKGRLREICKETGLLSEERAGETLRFIHLTFCEFLAAKEAIHGRETGWLELISVHREFATKDVQSATKLIEVLPFAAGLTSRVMRARMLDDIAALSDSRVLGRVFLETHAYDHPIWTSFASSEAAFLTSSPQSRWDDEWLQRLHLFTVILTDEAEWRQAYNRAPAAITHEQLLKMLIQGDRTRLVAVLGSYASVDPQAAFRLAQSLQVDLIADHPAVIVENLSNYPLYSLVIEDLSTRPTPELQQALIVCEAAMLNPFAGFNLSDEPYSTLRFPAPSSIPRRFRWYTSDKDLNLLSYSASIISNAHLTDVIDEKKFPRCARLAALKPPGAFLFTRFLWFGRWRVLALSFAFYAASAVVALDRTSGRLFLWASSLGISAFFWIASSFIFYRQERMRHFEWFLLGLLHDVRGRVRLTAPRKRPWILRIPALLAVRASQPLLNAATAAEDATSKSPKQ